MELLSDFCCPMVVYFHRFIVSYKNKKETERLALLCIAVFAGGSELAAIFWYIFSLKLLSFQLSESKNF